jgi:hypothetical protein
MKEKFKNKIDKETRLRKAEHGRPTIQHVSNAWNSV